jgi:hypothetical protein
MVGLALGQVVGGLRRREAQDRDDAIEDEKLERDKQTHGLRQRAGESQISRNEQEMEHATAGQGRLDDQNDRRERESKRSEASEARKEADYKKKNTPEALERENKKANAEVSKAESEALRSKSMASIAQLNAAGKKAMQARELALSEATNERDVAAINLRTQDTMGQISQQAGVQIYDAYKKGDSELVSDLVNSFDGNGVKDAYIVEEVTRSDGLKILRVTDENGVVAIDPRTKQPMVFDANKARMQFSGAGTLHEEDGEMMFRPKNGAPMFVMTDSKGNPMLAEKKYDSNAGPMTGTQVHEGFLKWHKDEVSAGNEAGFEKYKQDMGIVDPDAKPAPKIRIVPEGTPGAKQRKRKGTDEWVWTLTEGEGGGGGAEPSAGTATPSDPQAGTEDASASPSVPAQEPASLERRAELAQEQAASLARGRALLGESSKGRVRAVSKREKHRDEVLEQLAEVFAGGDPQAMVDLWVDEGSAIEGLLDSGKLTLEQYKEAKAKATAAQRFLSSERKK